MSEFSTDLLKERLLQPVPSFVEARNNLAGYRQYPIDFNDSRMLDPIVPIADFGLAGAAYYSRPNVASVEPINGVDPALFLRKSVAEKLARINGALQGSSIIAEMLDGQVELYLEDALRTPQLQGALFNEVFPAHIRREHPEWNDEQVYEQRNNLIAAPPSDERSPSPHSTGGAMDVILRHKQAHFGYAPETEVFMGHFDGATMANVFPDYFEGEPNELGVEHQIIAAYTNEQRTLAQRNRRILYAVMNGVLTGEQSGLQVNPNEHWHWSYGDQMWAHVRQEPAAFYSFPQVS